MRLYCWRAKSYDGEAFVVATNLKAAHQALLDTKKSRPTEQKPSREHVLWLAWFEAECHNRMIDNMLALKDYELIVLEPGQVAWAERS